MSFNKWIGTGNLTADPEIRYTQSGKAVCNFRLAVNPNKKDAKPEDTLFINIVAWERLAESCNTFLRRGSRVMIEGRLTIRQYDDKDGNRRQATEIVCENMEMLDKRSDGSSNGSSNGAVPAHAGGGGEFSDEEPPVDFN